MGRYRGGPGGYASLLRILANTKHPEHKDMSEWLGDQYPDGFDPECFEKDVCNAIFAKGLPGVRKHFNKMMLEDSPEDDEDELPPIIIPFPGL
jgi:hypothetical protein